MIVGLTWLMMVDETPGCGEGWGQVASLIWGDGRVGKLAVVAMKVLAAFNCR